MRRDVRLQVDGLNIVGQLYLPGKIGPPYPGVILCHGIPSGIVDPADGGYPLLAKTVSAEGFAVLTFSFRGSGASQGNFNIAGWSHDLEAAIDYLWGLPEIDDAQISVVGFSAGASVSIYVAAQDKRVSAVVACACPSSFSAISETKKPQDTVDYFRQIGIIRDPGYPQSTEKWLSDFRKINALHCVADIAPRPLLLVHASGDSVVPLHNAERLYQKAGEPKQIVVLEGSEHRLRRHEKAVSEIICWLKEQAVSSPA